MTLGPIWSTLFYANACLSTANKTEAMKHMGNFPRQAEALIMKRNKSNTCASLAYRGWMAQLKIIFYNGLLLVRRQPLSETIRAYYLWDTWKHIRIEFDEIQKFSPRKRFWKCWIQNGVYFPPMVHVASRICCHAMARKRPGTVIDSAEGCCIHCPMLF